MEQFPPTFLFALCVFKLLCALSWRWGLDRVSCETCCPYSVRITGTKLGVWEVGLLRPSSSLVIRSIIYWKKLNLQNRKQSRLFTNVSAIRGFTFKGVVSFEKKYSWSDFGDIWWSNINCNWSTFCSCTFFDSCLRIWGITQFVFFFHLFSIKFKRTEVTNSSC